MQTEKEIESLVRFLGHLSTRKRGEQKPNTFRSRNINLSIVLIGHPRKVHRLGPYLGYIEKKIRDGVSTFYLLARGRINVLTAESVAEEAQKKQLVEIADKYIGWEQVDTRIIRAACIHLEKTSRTRLLNT